MDKRESYFNDSKVNSNVLEGDGQNSKSTVEYYKKVEKTMTKTVIKEGDNNPSKKVVSTTTIIKEGDNPGKISNKVYSSIKYGNMGKEQSSSRKFESLGNFKNLGTQQISQKITSSNSKYTGLQPSFQTIKFSGNYSNKGEQQKTSQKIISTTNSKNNNYLVSKGNISINQNYTKDRSSRLYSSSSQQKERYSFASSSKEKNNYMNHVSDIRYMSKERAPIKQEKKETKIYKSQSIPKTKSISKPIARNERTTLRIITTRKERAGRKENNYEYLESKDIKDQKRDTIVIHRRWGEPFYQIISDERKKFSSYTSGARGYKSNYSLSQKDYGVASLTKGVRTIETESENNYKYKNNTENKRGIIDTSKYRNISNSNKYQKKAQSVSSVKESQSNSIYRNNKNNGERKYNSSYQRTVNVEEIRKKYGQKGRYEQSYTEGNTVSRGGKMNREIKRTDIKYSSVRGSSGSSSQGRYNKSIQSSKEYKKSIPQANKKYEEKTADSYKKGKRQFNLNQNKKIYDKENYKRDNQGTSKYQSKTEEFYKKEIYSSKYKKGGYEQNKYQMDKKGKLDQQKQKEKDKLSQYQKGKNGKSFQPYNRGEDKNQFQETGEDKQNYQKEGYGTEPNYQIKGNDTDEKQPGSFGQNYQIRGNDSNEMNLGSSGQKYQLKGNDSDVKKTGSSGQKYQMEEYSPDQYHQQREEIYQKEMEYTPQLNDKQQLYMNDGAHFCPIHGLNMPGNKGQMYRNERGDFRDSQSNKFRYIQEQGNDIIDAYGDESHNYKFYESKNVTKKSENMNSINIQNEKNVNIVGQGKGSVGRGMEIEISKEETQRIQNAQLLGNHSSGVQGAQLLEMQSNLNMKGSQLLGFQSSSRVDGFDYSKAYIATRTIPVYSDISNQLFSNNVCNVCGNPFGQGQIINSQQISYNSCPIHGQTMIQQQQYSGY